ncbi:MAG: tetratricopeptide repeat protein, partial [Chloroflexi bacterium]
MPDFSLLERFLAAPDGEDALSVIAAEPDALLSDETLAAIDRRIAATPTPPAHWQERRELLESLRGMQDLFAQAQTAAERLGERLIAWIQTPDWGASEAYLRDAPDLLGDEAAEVLRLLQLGNPDNQQIPLHIQLLQQCREAGIPVAYAQLRQELAQARGLADAARQMQENPLLAAVAAFLQAEDSDAQALLQSERALLLTDDTRNLLQQLLEAARQQNDAPAAERLAARLALWNAAMRQRAGGPLRRAAAATDWQEQPHSGWLERAEQRAVVPERGQQLTVVSAVNSAIGPGATVFNIVNVGEIALRWHRPQQTRPALAQSAVGRESELAELHRRLAGQQAAALVGKGAAPAGADRAAVRGMAGIGKTVLAALYATRHADDYPGGVIWLTVGPAKRTQTDLAAELQSLAAHAYADPIQAQKLLENCMLSPQAVQGLLAGHGRLLIVCDDVWSEEVAAELAAAAPPEAALLLTTRDYDVAYALARSPQAIQRLDVLSDKDARLLLQERAPGLPDDLADQVAQGLGCHAQALNLAGAALHTRGSQRFAETGHEILQRVREGRGFGDLPRMDKAERVSEVEIALGYSYDLLGQGSRGPQQQGWLRGLGAFAQEADFDNAAAAALWQIDDAQAQEFLLALDGLGLAQEVAFAPDQSLAGFAQRSRWQQHAILRAYALSLQDEEERLRLPQRHADHYLALAQACYDASPRRDDQVEAEFAQIENAFAWCNEYSPARSVQLVRVLTDFMRNRGRITQLGDWLQSALDAAAISGSRLGTANTLQSLGDLESRLGNIEAARGHYDAALPLFAAEQARLGTANTLQSLGDLESRLGNIEAARGHYDAALPLFAAE